MKQESKGKFTIKTTESPQAIFVVPGGVLDKAGVKPKDELIQMGDDNISQLSTFEDFRNAVAKYKDQKINFTYKNAQKEFKTVQITPEINKENQAVIGVVPAYVVSKTATNWPSGVSMAIDEIGQTFKLTFDWFGKAGRALLPQSTDRSALSQTSGPIGVGYIGGEVYKIAGFGGILYLVGAISVSLAIFNMLPIPALDGGRFILLTISKITGRRNKKLEGALIGFTFIFLFGLMILVAFKDLWSIVSPK
jgi:regulator of sigma E protease